ncbi:MAG: restriction endonuclease subunit R [Candidatus Poribacteria bacterium]|nr:restriction endonuclease subunit R [Candidatus Poribacteria bacterium]MDE0502770.1 restriction endonuclease subunit R [Candidatus Poribacteria bacterium]
MVDEVLSVIEKWQSDERLTSLGEARIRTAVIEPILRGLGWDTTDPDEVWPEFRVENNEVDYALLIDKKLKVFVEAKKGGEPLEKHQEQLLGYSFKQGVKVAILTNGAMWWFYLPLQEGSWEQRKFETVELHRQDKAEISQELINLLSKENVNSGKAVQNAEDLRKKHQFLKTLPDAWNQLVSEPDSFIVERLGEKTRELCGREPDKNSVEQFLSEHIDRIKIMSSAVAPPTPDHGPSSKPATPQRSLPRTNLSGRSRSTTCTAFTFRGTRYPVQSWGDMIVKLCEILHESHGDRFVDEVLRLSANYSRNPNDIASGASRQISGTDIFVNVHGGMVIENRARTLISRFGYNANDLSLDIGTY